MTSHTRNPYTPSSSTTNLLPPGQQRSSPRDTPLRSGSPSPSVSSKYALPVNPKEWEGIALDMNSPEPDDYLHNPDPRRDRHNDQGGSILTLRGIANLGCLFILAVGILALFGGYPVISHFTTRVQTDQGGFGPGGTNASGQVPVMPGLRGLIDADTPQEAYSIPSFTNQGETLELVFSDEFNVDGRTFYPGDDPYWEAVDLYYWQTADLEWYDPEGAITAGGYLNLTLSEKDPINNHNLSYMSGMIQTWNKFCFTGGIVVTSVRLPGKHNISGLWPAVWSMGNLGRAGYGASLEGMWPYSYDSCDVGTLPNQSFPNSETPQWAFEGGDPKYNNQLSVLQGQRLSACTCPGESHPGPALPNGSYVGRAAPEIDVFEATITGQLGQVSQSGQWAPFNAGYNFTNVTNGQSNAVFYNTTLSALNGYRGGAVQQTTSGLTTTNQGCYELDEGCFSVYGFEYQPGTSDGFITWVSDGVAAWTLYGDAMGPDSRSNISSRVVSQEPMYLMANLGYSTNFGFLDKKHLTFPATMLIDYIRVYQLPSAKNIGCDPASAPTMDYINTYTDAYNNPNLTTWVFPSYNQTNPKNRLLDGGC